MPPATEQVQITLHYSGPDVDDGTMSVDDLVPVLQGFASAYGKIAAEKGYSTQHRLRVAGIHKGSANIILDVWETIGRNSQHLQAVGTLSAAVVGVVMLLLQVVKVKKHVKKQPYSAEVDSAAGGIAIVNSENVSLTISTEVYNLFKEKTVDGDLSRIVRPLEPERVDTSSIIVQTGAQRTEETISVTEKKYFDVASTVAANTGETWLTGTINSMTKSSNSGHVYLADGTRVHYKLVNDHPEQFYSMFQHRGPVKVRCVAQLDENLRPTNLDVFDIVPLQRSLDFDGNDLASDDCERGQVDGTGDETE
jgi:hypothetical protein